MRLIVINIYFCTIENYFAGHTTKLYQSCEALSIDFTTYTSFHENYIVSGNFGIYNNLLLPQYLDKHRYF